ncbi:hypothetical protein MJG53_015312 [Ovis ammon polii x Ovis aries]|uniref:Uncharacterized protein n=1 Tax=Ovis ammon polii x Ovis aries TaxID=2918886 RepID=A0ACB9UFD8_9CETA|nr:hypothetical protein MJG53_015312 [Ovis ammon polii x Ovis aries]
MEGTRINSLVWEDSTRYRTSLCTTTIEPLEPPRSRNCCAHALEPVRHKTSHGNEKPVPPNKEQAPLAGGRESPCEQQTPNTDRPAPRKIFFNAEEIYTCSLFTQICHTSRHSSGKKDLRLG